MEKERLEKLEERLGFIVKKLEMAKEERDIISDEIARRLKAPLWSIDTDNIAEFYIYENDYDYKNVKIKLLTEENRHYLEIEEYLEIIKYMLDNNIYIEHKASILEKIVVDLINKNESENLYVFDGKLCTSNQDYEWELADIKEFHIYDDEDSLIKFYNEYDKCEYIVSFMHDEVIEFN